MNKVCSTTLVNVVFKMVAKYELYAQKNQTVCVISGLNYVCLGRADDLETAQ